MLPVIEFDDAEVQQGEPRGDTVERAAGLFREHGVLLLHRVFRPEFIDSLHAAFVDRYRAMYRDQRRVRHGGTANASERERPILYLSYQRVWFRDYDGYNKAPPVHVGDAAFGKVPLRYRELFAWARADNTPETLRLALRRLVKRNTPDAVKRALRRFR